MKKLNLAVAFALSLAVPFGAMASSDDATIRAMGMNDNASAAAIMKDIAISENANITAKGNVERANKNRARGHMETEYEIEVVENVVKDPVEEEPTPTPPPPMAIPVM